MKLHRGCSDCVRFTRWMMRAFLCWVVVVVPCAVAVSCDCDMAANRQGLVDLYDATGGPSAWRTSDLTGWSSSGRSAALCSWTGITCAAQDVIKITLEGRGLTGTIPDAVITQSFPNLETLAFPSNSLTGPIPTSLAQLSKLEDLVLTSNSIAGSIPGALSQLHLLKTLSVGDNQIHGALPAWAGTSFPRLRRMQLNNNLFTGSLPSEWGSLTYLTELDLTKSGTLNGTIPSTWSLLSNLTQFRMGGNLGLSGEIPDGLFGSMRNLNEIDVSLNAFHGTLPTSIAQCVRLTAIDASLNVIGGTIPRGWSALTKLERIVLNNNALDGTLPPEFGEARLPLGSLSLENNHLQGTIPKEWSKLEGLSLLTLSNNSLTGTLPSAGWPKLSWFEAAVNQLTGPLPDNWGGDNCSALTSLDINTNMLNGTIPESYGKCLRLTRLFLNTNNLTGTIPAALGALAKLETLWLDHNSLVGPIPDTFGSLAKLRDIDVTRNFLSSSSLPSSFSNLRNLQSMRLRQNALGGTLPASWGVGLEAIESLDVSQNSIVGTIPESWGSMKAMGYFSAGWNPLTGTIPWTLGGLGSLATLQLAFCDLEGPLPVDLSLATTLTHIALSGNARMNGTLPRQWSLLTNLQILMLDHTAISGTIPSSYSALPLLQGGSLYLFTSCHTHICGSVTPLRTVGWMCFEEGTTLPSNFEDVMKALVAVSVSLPPCNVSTPSPPAQPNGSSNTTNPAPTQTVAVVSVNVVSASVAGALIALVANPAVASALTRSARFLELLKCATEQDDNSTPIGTLRAAALGYLLSMLIPAVCVVCWVAATQRHLPMSMTLRRRGFSRLEATLARWGLPGKFNSVVEVVAPTAMDVGLGIVVMAASSSSLEAPSAGDLTLAVITLLCGVSFLTWFSIEVTIAFQARWREMTRMTPDPPLCAQAAGCSPATLGVVAKWVDTATECGSWVSADVAPAFVALYGALFEECRCGRHWYLAVETLLTLIVSGLGAVSYAGLDGATCAALLPVAAAVQVLACVLLVVLRPYLTRWAAACALTLGAGGALAAVLGVIPSCDACQNASDLIGQIQFYLAVALGLAGVGIRWVFPRRPLKDQGTQRISTNRVSRRPSSRPLVGRLLPTLDRRLEFGRSQEVNLKKIVQMACARSNPTRRVQAKRDETATIE
jgi:Leucine-rich repeat (LRR) protein